MKIDPVAGYLVVSFSPEDFKHPAGGALKVIGGIKEFIGHHSKNEDGFDYDSDSFEWYIGDTAKNRAILEKLRDEFLRDKNQLAMFGDGKKPT